MKHRLIQGDCLQVLPALNEQFDCIFADPFDNIGLSYDEHDDRMSDEDYYHFLNDLVIACTQRAPTVWISFNAKWTFAMGAIFHNFEKQCPDWETKACQQVFTFGQHNKHDLGNNHRPLYRLKHKDAPLYPEQIKVPSWRQRNGDKRAAPGGRVPGDVLDFQYPDSRQEAERLLKDLLRPFQGAYASGDDSRSPGNAEVVEKLTAIQALLEQPGCGDVFDFPRVTGNSKQRCDWHPTQLHEDLVERCIKLSTPEGGTVADPFGGTATTMRVCQRINRSCTLIEKSAGYCKRISADTGVPTILYLNMKELSQI